MIAAEKRDNIICQGWCLVSTNIKDLDILYLIQHLSCTKGNGYAEGVRDISRDEITLEFNESCQLCKKEMPINVIYTFKKHLMELCSEVFRPTN